MLLNTGNKKDLKMKLFDLDSPQTKQSKKVLESYFGNNIDFAALNPKDASDMLTKVRGLIYEHRTTRPVVQSENSSSYMKLIVMERGLHARLREANITLEPQTGATQIKNDGDVIGSTDDQATAMQFKKDVEDGKITLGEQGQSKHEFIRALFKSYFGQPQWNELTGGRSGMRRLKIGTGGNMPDTNEFQKQLKAAGLSDDVRVKKAKDGSYITVLYPDDFRMQSITEAENWIKKATSKNPGAFTRQAKAAGMSTTAFANKVLANKDDYNAKTEKRANLAKTLSKFEGKAGKVLNQIAEGATLKMSGRVLSESEVQQAQVVLAAQDMVDRMQKMLEDVTSMQFKDLPALSSSIQTTIGTNEAQAFNDAAGQSLAVLVDSIQAAKVEMETAQGTLTGVAPVVPGQEEVAGTPAVAEPVADPLAADPIDATADVNVDAEAGGEAVDVNVDVQDGALGRARR